MTPKPKKPTRLNAALYAILLEELVDGTATRREMAERTGLSAQTILSLVTALHKRGLIHVAAWERDAVGRHSIPAFQFGRKRDVARPAPLTKAECKRQQRARQATLYVHHAIAGTAATGQA